MQSAPLGEIGRLLFGRADHGWSRSRKIAFWTLAFLTLSAVTVALFALLAWRLL